MVDPARAERRDAVAEMKRTIILDAARHIFEVEGLQGASMRAIAKAAGYTPGAIYAYFPNKEHIYAAALGESLDRLREATEDAAADRGPVERFIAAGLAFFDFYDTNPRDLDLGFYLFRGGIRPQGLSEELNTELNTKLLACLEPLRAAAIDHGTDPGRAQLLMADVLAHASGLLLLAHTKRLALFDLNARNLMDAHLHGLAATFE
ncbi:TetR/AcrR family transcriptional regulator [Rhodococcus sp. G-MC3]|uniref:TetR/AcrR family transcriptional regulator n=1 Tax=Rhodococcus sp. G-MC3 TaxID=3046209 RepID=UPI0024BBA3C5|nr:TetR/AcrR family transcriptional regulator [Rhodococcus sp. G-MC3]MDJ0396589.1 TetR/AcrR family transcriptional regulator [Rhodococcus sp. G-MC3]